MLCCWLSSDRVAEQAYTFADIPLYATQFHPELNRAGLIERLEAYPKYVEQIAGIPLPQFEQQCREAPEANGLLKRFVEVVFGDN